MHQSRANNIVGFLNKKSFLTPSISSQNQLKNKTKIIFYKMRTK